VSDVFDRACAALAEALDGPFRGDVVRAASRSRTLGHGLNQIGSAMRSHVWRAGDRTIDLAAILDSPRPGTRGTKASHVLHDWGRQSCARHAELDCRGHARVHGPRTSPTSR
jgi:hypothetical protein